MELADKLELHYYFNDKSHDIDALVRNKCEAELLGILIETASLLEIDVRVLKEIYKEGGFRDIWKGLGKNSAELTLLLLIIQIIISAIPLFKSEKDDLEIEERKLSIEEKKLNIAKLKQDLARGNPEQAINKAASSIETSLKIIKRKSNFYAHLEGYQKLERVGFSVLNDNWQPVNQEKSVPRSQFNKFILSTNRLKSLEDENAIIEIISPVLKEGRYRWKGVYKDNPISFEMLDTNFRDAVLLENIPFQHGSQIVCVLVAHRELDEVGDVKITGYSVTTVLEKIDGDKVIQTLQGKQYRHAKKMADSQANLFEVPAKKLIALKGVGLNECLISNHS